MTKYERTTTSKKESELVNRRTPCPHLILIYAAARFRTRIARLSSICSARRSFELESASLISASPVEDDDVPDDDATVSGAEDGAGEDEEEGGNDWPAVLA